MQPIDQVFTENEEDLRIQLYLRKIFILFVVFAVCDTYFGNFFDVKLINAQPYSPKMVYPFLTSLIAITTGFILLILKKGHFVGIAFLLYVVHKLLKLYQFIYDTYPFEGFLLDLFSISASAFIYTWFASKFYEFGRSNFIFFKAMLLISSLQLLTHEYSSYLYIPLSIEGTGFMLPILFCFALVIISLIFFKRKTHLTIKPISLAPVPEPLWPYISIVVLGTCLFILYQVFFKNPHLTYYNYFSWHGKTFAIVSSFIVPFVILLFILNNRLKNERFLIYAGIIFMLISGVVLSLAIIKYPAYTNIPYLWFVHVLFEGYVLLSFGLSLIVFLKPPTRYYSINAILLLVPYPISKFILFCLNDDWVDANYSWFCPLFFGITVLLIAIFFFTYWRKEKAENHQKSIL